MAYTYHRTTPIRLADVGFDERWLQDRIQDDPAILGLGDLSILRRERKQSSGGRIDFLMSDPESDAMYEVEVMLGPLNESHIIRTIEYWDLERRRYQDREHCAVIIAEEITNRFFNVISLFNRAIPIVAIQLSAILVEEKIILNFTKVLDIFETALDEEETDAETTDRGWWEKRSSPSSVGIVDQCISLISSATGKQPRITYNKNHIAMGALQKNFCWFHPRISHCHINLRCEEADAPDIFEKLELVGVQISSRKKHSFKIIVTPQNIKDHGSTFREVFLTAAKFGGGFAATSAATLK